MFGRAFVKTFRPAPPWTSGLSYGASLRDNRVVLAERAAETLAKKVSSLGHDLQKVCKDLKWAPVSVAAQGHTPESWVNATLAIVLSILCVIGMAFYHIMLS